MPATLLDRPGADLDPTQLRAARAFLDAAGHAGGGSLHRCGRVLIARAETDGPIVAVVAGQRVAAMQGQRPVACLVVQQLCTAPGWARHTPLLRALGGALLAAGRGALVLWSAPSARAHAAASAALPRLQPRFGERLPGATAAIRDRVMSRTDPHGWDPLRGGISLRGPDGVPLTRHVCVVRSTPRLLSELVRRVAAAWWTPAPAPALPLPA